MAAKYRNILTAFYSTCWAILPEKLAVIEDFLLYQSMGGKLDATEIEARIGGRSSARPQKIAGDVAILPVLGVLSKRAGLLEESSGGTSTDMLGQQFDSLVRDDRIGAIVLDVDSPGGSVQGVTELAAKIRAARDVKPVVAVANGTAASAAYWVASQAGRVVATPSSEVGSIGVVAVHSDQSLSDAADGVKRTIFTAGKKKAYGNPFEPLTEEATKAIQDDVDRYYDMFVADVAAGRGVPKSEVKGGYGEGGVVGAREALKLGMVDAIGTLDDEVARLMGGGKSRAGMRAMEDRARSIRAELLGL